MHEKYLNTALFTSPSVIISLPCRSSSRINHLGTINAEHKVLSHLFSSSSPFKCFQQAAWPYSPSRDPRADRGCVLYFMSALEWGWGKKRAFS